jgi:hypothetical protein
MRRCFKIHFVVDVKIRGVVGMEVITDDIHDSKVLQSIMIDTSRHRSIAETYMDGAYDSLNSYHTWEGICKNYH